jgi:hypothetical protein
MAGRGKFSSRKKLHSASLGFGGFHRCQFTCKFQARPDIRLGERGIILQNLRVRLSGGDGAHDIGHEHARAAHDGFAVTNRRVKLNSI